jgi:hypothetical protein
MVAKNEICLMQTATVKGDKMECKQSQNLKHCNCSYKPCARKGICCECLQYHLKSRQLPGCCFPDKAEMTYDRSFEHFARLVAEGKA